MKRFILLVPFVLLCSFRAAVASSNAKEQSVTFVGAGNVNISGTLELPAADSTSPLPAIVLVQGSGPVDRDGNAPGIKTDLLRQIADALAAENIATLRFDKRGQYANAAEAPVNLKSLTDFCDWQNYVGDVAGAVAFLQRQKNIDFYRIGLLGHSEGGLLALAVATAPHMQSNPLAALILLSTPGRPSDQILHDQLTRLLNQQRATADQAKFFLDANDRITQEIRANGVVPPAVPPGLAALYPAYLGKFWQGQLKLDPARIAPGFIGPVLVVAGEKDIQVSPQKDGSALDATLKTRRPDDHKFVVISNASHNLKTVRNDSDEGFTGEVTTDAMQAITGWCKEKLAPSGKLISR